MERLNIHGVRVCAVNMNAAIEEIGSWIDRNEHRYVCALNVHSVVEGWSDSELMRIHNEAGLAVPDGMPLVWLLRQAGLANAARVSGPDLMLNLFEHSEASGYRHFLYGATERTLWHLGHRLAEAYPKAQIVGSLAPPFRPLTPQEDDAIVETINKSGAQIVWVGLGAPKQERWMAAHHRRLAANVMIGVGAAFDMHAGLVKRAPVALQRCGAEWAYRLAVEPRRLWKRYLTTNSRFITRVAIQMAGLARFKLEA
jgi:N-acetylglucosaminyldiphosphoundecaprenol N-acetyl-beta-D-mannosaminyltransferase